MNRKMLMLIPIVAAFAAFGSFTVYDSNEQIVMNVNSVIIPFTIEEATQIADYVIIGTVEKITPILVDMPKESDEDLVFTDIVINVKEDLLGTADKQISVRVLGGEVVNRKVIAQQSGEFTIGDEILLFISSAERYGYDGKNFILAQNNGVYDMIGETAKNQATDEIFNRDNLSSQIKEAVYLQN